MHENLEKNKIYRNMNKKDKINICNKRFGSQMNFLVCFSRNRDWARGCSYSFDSFYVMVSKTFVIMSADNIKLYLSIGMESSSFTILN